MPEAPAPRSMKEVNDAYHAAQGRPHLLSLMSQVKERLNGKALPRQLTWSEPAATRSKAA